jgi:membrane protein implicated in regulation of membrane protease activity
MMGNSLFDLIANNHDKVLYAIAAIAFIIELTLIGLSGPLLFFAFGSLITGTLISLNILYSWEVEIFSIALFTFISALILWKPIKKFQGNNSPVADTSSDMIGQIVPISEMVTSTSGQVRHSGINWNARLSEKSTLMKLDANQRGIIVAVQGNILILDQLS